MSLHYVELPKGFPQAIWEFQYCTNLSSGVRLGGTAPWWVRSDLAKVSSPVIRHVRKIINIFMYIIFINIINSEMWIVFHIDVYTPEASEAIYINLTGYLWRGISMLIFGGIHWLARSISAGWCGRFVKAFIDCFPKASGCDAARRKITSGRWHHSSAWDRSP